MSQKENRPKFSLKGRVVFLATNNIHKFDEYRTVLSKHQIVVGMLRVKNVEVQSDSLSKIAQSSVRDAFKLCNLPVIVEDAGLFIEALNGFPGPYASYVYRKLSNQGILKILKGERNRKAKFKAVVAYLDGERERPVCFEGESEGSITLKEHGGSGQFGFGFDPIFQPLEKARTFAELTIEEKNSVSHRGKAAEEFSVWYSKLR
jgi:XTP/dITP diphosphohydrolase